MKKGFTLMEILAVLLIIAVIASFAVPAINAVRAEVRYQRAKSAALKMAEAIRSYYRDSKGHLPASGNIANPQPGTLTSGTCDRDLLNGIPAGSDNLVSVMQLFYCNYLSPKDFEGLPYTFMPNDSPRTSNVLVTATGSDGKAGRYNGHTIIVKLDMSIEGSAENI